MLALFHKNVNRKRFYKVLYIVKCRYSIRKYANLEKKVSNDTSNIDLASVQIFYINIPICSSEEQRFFFRSFCVCEGGGRGCR